MRLATLQQALCDHLAQVPVDGEAPVNPLHGFVGDHPGLSVYRNNYRGSLRDCLRNTHEHSWSWLGDEGFDAAADSYIALHTPHHWSLDAYGEGFARHLAACLPDDPEVAELAWLEWALARAFDGADAEPLSAAGLGDVDWEQARFTFVPTLTLGTMTTNAAAIWTALAGDQPPPQPAILPAPATVLVWRNGLAPCFRTLEPAEARALRGAQAGASFGAICAMLAEELDEEAAAGAAGALLGQWLGERLIAAIA